MNQFGFFRVEETHGILTRPENRNRSCSDGLGWTSLYASAQCEMPFEGQFPAVRDQLVVLHIDGPVAIDSTYGPKPVRSIVPAGGLHLVPGGVDFGVKLAAPLNTVHVYLRRRIIEEVAADIAVGDPALVEIPPRLVAHDPSLGALMTTIRLALDGDDYGTATYVDYLARAMATQLILRHSNASLRSAPPEPQSDAVSAIISRAIAFMRDNIDMRINVDQIAKAVNCSASHLARQFRASVGVPPHQYLLELRIRKAQQMLATTGESIAEIAFACGFSHQEHLTRMFRRWCDTTPAVYRKTVRN